MKIKVILIIFLFQTFSAFGQILPANIFSDNMVLQREVSIPIWGIANPGERIIVSLKSITVVTITKSDGRWMANLPRFSAGGPYDLKIKGSIDSVEFKNVLIGDVWFVSGQSNMEHPMNGWEFIPHSDIYHSKEEIADSDYPEIRLFSVPKYPSPIEQKDLPAGKWEIANPEAVTGFSSTAWFFAKDLYQKIKIPIGIINSSWGGTTIKTWMSRESLESFSDSVNLQVVPEKFNQKAWSEEVTESIEKNRIRRNQISYPKVGLPEEINKSDFYDPSWKLVDLLDTDNHFGNIVWLQKKIIVPEPFSKQKLELSLGFLNWQSQVFINGIELGYFIYPKPVKIGIPRKFVHVRENILTIRLAQPWSEPQVLGGKKQFFISNPNRSFFINISKNWKANDQLEPIIPIAKSYQNNPSFLFNGMVAPIISYGIKGFVWYQGEADAGQPFLYEKMFQQLITDWRKLWKQGDLPFLFVQISNIDLSHEFEKKDNTWCLLREAQQKALSLPQTGMVVSIDIGDSLDIHPKNKQDFGHRLALQALKIAYHEDIIADGPVYELFEIKDDTVVIQLKDENCPLEKKIDLCSFEIAGKNRIFHDAKAYLRKNEIYVFSEKVKNPVAVRYAWSNNPKCCIFNKVGLPLAPFRAGNI